MDRKDKLILKELDRDARQSHTKLAKKVGLSKDTVNYRIKKLEQRGIIREYYSIVDYYKLGYWLTKILIKFTNIGEKGEEKIVRWLEKKPEILWVAKTEGYWDVIYTLQVRSIKELLNSLERFKKTFPTSTVEFQMLIAQNFSFLNEKYLYEEKDVNKFEEIKMDASKVQVDEKDELIIKKLEENSRTPLIVIAEQLKLTPEAILQRIRKLEKSKIIRRYKARLNVEKIDLEYNHVYLSVKDYTKIKMIEEYYKRSDFCTFVMHYQGNYHVHLEWVTKRGELRSKIKELKEKFGDYLADYHVIHIFEEYKIL